jgi:chromosomal replication initiator protein
MAGPISTIQSAVAEAWGISVMELLSHRRPKPLIQARAMAAGLARELTGASYPLLGREFDRDHTSILNAVRRDKELVHRDADYAAMRRAVVAKLGQ